MSLTADLARTPLSSWHAEHGGRLVDFAGWAMPVQYGSIVAEHQATRRGVGVFDVSHMGRLSIVGPAAAAWVDGLVTRRVADLPQGLVRYALLCNEAGGVLDDVLVTRVADERVDVVVNASNRPKVLAWLADHRPESGVTVEDRTEATAMIAVQGPAAADTLSRLSTGDLQALRYYRAGEGVVVGAPCGVSRTGYTGEDGFELVCDAIAAERVWTGLVAAGATPCGLAARDTLRLEAGMPLYGHELSERLNPVHAGLGFAVELTDKAGRPREFVGREAILLAKEDGALARRVGLLVEGKRPPREDYRVLVDGRPCGVVTSGTASPTLGRPIAMAYVEPSLAAEGTRLAVDVSGVETPAVVTPLPFYRRAA